MRSQSVCQQKSVEWSEFETRITKEQAQDIDELVVRLKTETDLEGWEAYEALIKAGLRRTGFIGVADGRISSDVVGAWIVEKTSQMAEYPNNTDEYENRSFIVSTEIREVLRGMSRECGRPDLPSEADVFTAFITLGFEELSGTHMPVKV